MTGPSHPYYPLSASIPHYVANNGNTLYLVSMFAITLAAVLLPALLLVKHKVTSLSSRVAFLWFLTCGCIHFFFEGYFAYFHKDLAAHSTLFGELWKEYSLSDSRYLTSDSFVLWMETITAVAWGPTSFLIAYWIFTDNPKRHLLIVVTSVGQIYGDILYYMTTLFEGAPHSRPESYYFWVYFVMMNAFWIVIPTYYIIESGAYTLKALAQSQPKSSSKKIQ